jgi:hypothetical protein
VLQWFYNAKSVFITVNASLRWLNNVTGVYLVQASLLLIGQQGFERFFKYQLSLPIGWSICKFYANAGGKRPIHRQSLLVQYNHQANPLISINNYTLVVLSRNDKNKQLTLSSKPQTRINRKKQEIGSVNSEVRV